MFNEIIKLLNEADKHIEDCPKELISGDALVKIAKAIEKLKDIKHSLTVPIDKRYIVTWKKWYCKKESEVYHRWDNAFAAAVLSMSLLYCDFKVKLTKAENDGQALEFTISNSQATIIVETKSINRKVL